MSRQIIKNILSLAIVVFVGGCSSGKITSKRGWSSEDPSRSRTEDIESIVILGTNDIHGAVFPMELKSKESDSVQPADYASGGVTVLASYIRRLQGQYKNRLIWLDGGDEFQGTIESNTNGGAPIVDFFNHVGLHAAAVGNHEFDFGLSTLKERMKSAKYTYMAANWVDRKTEKLPNDYSHLSTRLMIPVNQVKVGVIGLSTLDTPTTTRAEYVQGYDFNPLKEATLHEAQALRAEGADVVVVVAHAGLMCEIGRGVREYSLRRPTDPQGECRDQDEIVQLLRSIPAGTVDAVVSGHTHQVIHHWVAGVPVIQGGARGHYFNLIHLKYDRVKKKVLNEETIIEGPVPVCEKVFENQDDCNGDRPTPKGGRGPLVQNQFRGDDMHPDAQLTQVYAPIAEKTFKVRKEVIGRAEMPLDHDRFKETPLGNLVTDAMREATGADVALTNPGGLRERIPAGEITYEHLFRTLPFDNSVWVIDVTGKELKLLLRVVESGWKGYFPTSGLKLRLISLDSDAPSSDLNRNGRIDPWEVDRLKEVRLENGTKVSDRKTYRLAIVDFLATGGDQVGWVMDQIPKSRIHFENAPLLREVVQRAIMKRSPLNTAKNALVSTSHPRVVYERMGTTHVRKKKKTN